MVSRIPAGLRLDCDFMVWWRRYEVRVCVCVGGFRRVVVVHDDVFG